MSTSHMLTRRSVLPVLASALAVGTAIPGLAASRGQAPEFTGLDGWINSGPLSLAALRGRPVLVNFWARQCYNCRNAMPSIKGWYAKYGDKGFVVVGVHTPEFEIEKSRPALEAAVARMGITHPVAQDNASATWNAYGNQFWPAEYLIDQSGRIIHTHFGEGGYAQTEQLIQGLLSRG